MIAYKEALKRVKFHGPTIFSEVIKMAAEYASAETMDNKKYSH